MGFSSIISMMSPKSKLFDYDAQLFFNAQSGAGVTLTTTQMNAVNQWVVDSKAAGIWNKMKAVYPMVGGTATAHKFNLINPLDTDAAFRLNFVGGGTHSSNGYLPNGVNSYANTWFMPSINATASNISAGVYLRTNNITASYQFGGLSNAGEGLGLSVKYTDNNTYFAANNYLLNGAGNYVTDTRGLFIVNKFGATTTKLYKNGLTIATATPTTANVSQAAYVFIGARAVIPSIVDGYDNKENAFSFIGNTLTDLESQLFYQITEKFQVALGRNVNTTQSFYYNSAYNNETNAFLFSTQITDNTIQTATNTLVSDLKTAGVFTKMKAIYPMVGGTATTHKYNLINPQDTNAAYRLSFAGGWTHSATGMLPNGTNAYADTFLTPSTALQLNNSHISSYLRTNLNSDAPILSSENASSYQDGIYIWPKRTSLGFSVRINDNTSDAGGTASDNILGLHVLSRTSSSSKKYFLNNTIRLNTTTISSGLNTNSIYIGASRNNPNYFNNEIAFSSIGDGLSDAESLVFFNAVNAFQVSLARNV